MLRPPQKQQVVAPAISKKWKACFDFKPTLLTSERTSFYDPEDYRVDLKFEYDPTSGDDHYKKKVLEL